MPDTDKIISAIGQASYVWDVASGEIEWSPNFRELVGIEAGHAIGNARDFEALLSQDSPKTRFAAIHEQVPGMPDQAGAPYQCTYALRGDVVQSGRLLWIEDTGRWYPGENGKPKHAEGIVRIVNERRQREENLRRKSEIDDLTGLANRQLLQDTIRKTADDCFMNNMSAAFLLVALDDFERINHTYGFAVGDEVLQKVSWLLRQQMRSEDFPARFSGAKFGVIMKECSREHVHAAADRLVSGINNRILHTSGGPLALKLSAGACLLPGHALHAPDAIAAATAALDRSRHSFGKSFCLFEPDPAAPQKRAEKARLLNRFVDAIENNQINLAFQPVVDSVTGKAMFHEALLRLKGLEDDLINDAGFIHLAEDLGLMRTLDLRALQLGMQTLASAPKSVLSINVTHDSLECSNWLTELRHALECTTGIAERLIVELTESHLPKDIAGTTEAIREIQQLGCRVAIDDFGAGYTSFVHLRDLGVDLVKIDGSYAKDLVGGPENGVFLSAVRDMTRSFGIKTVVEWVEDIDTAVKLREMGHDYLQGSLYGMPLTVSPWEKSAGTTKKQIAERQSDRN